MDQNPTQPTQPDTPPSHEVNPASTNQVATHDQKPKKDIPWLKLIVFVLVGIITIAAFGLIAYLMIGQSKSDSNQIVETEVKAPPISPDPTAEWEMYTGDEFSFKIPPGWITAEAFDPESSPNLSINLAITRSDDTEVRTPIVIMRYENPNNLSADKWQEEYNKNRPRSRTFWQPSDTKSELNEFTIYQSDKVECEPFFCHQTLIVPDGYVYQIYTVIDELTYSEDELAENKTVYDQVLSTFKFTDTETTMDTSDWETYNGDGFSFKYPDNYSVEERVDNFYVIVPPNEKAATAGISIDARLSDNLSSYNTAITPANLTDVTVINYQNGMQITGNLGPDYGEGTKVTQVILPYKTGAISIESSDPKITEEFFDQILKTFKFTEKLAPLSLSFLRTFLLIN